ncbi:hypothetical protein DC345_14320 [Paenibacillus taichungensis]|uniref:Uncharacterized protein n=1 Tax=Paenibacillus taichungensis TaxID=484184 RepID=A0A329QS28_9BACL|nr:hypothetical protein [Paenibacillus taichungensis]RAW15200.1 hypothetical protein DC345_14320 [Paenibacillus taichungensis]
MKKLHTPGKGQDQQLEPEGRWRYVEMPGNQDTYVTHMKANQPPKGIMERNFITQMRRLHGLSAEKQM